GRLLPVGLAMEQRVDELPERPGGRAPLFSPQPAPAALGRLLPASAKRLAAAAAPGGAAERRVGHAQRQVDLRLDRGRIQSGVPQPELDAVAGAAVAVLEV